MVKYHMRSLAMLVVPVLFGLTLMTACQSLLPSSALTSSGVPFTSPLAMPTVTQAISTIATPLPTGSTSQLITNRVPPPSRPNLSTITGVLMVNKESPTPVGEVILYLATIHTDDAGRPLVASFDRRTSPRTQTDASGRFVFADVPSEPYALILDRISEAFMLNSPDNNGDMLFRPLAGEILDVGQLIYGTLPQAGPMP